MKHEPVFYDPAGRRHRVVGSGTRVLGAFAALLSTVFIVSLFYIGLIPQFAKAKHLIPSNTKPDTPSGVVLGRTRADLIRLIRNSKRRPNAPVPSAQRIIGFYTKDDAGFGSFTRNCAKLTHFMPQWLKISADGSRLDTSEMDSDQHFADIRQKCRTNGVKIEPVLFNDSNDPSSAHVARLMLKSKSNRRAVITQLRSLCLNEQFFGVNIDIEGLAAGDRGLLVTFLDELRAAFRGTELQLSTDLEVGAGPRWQAKFAAPCDFAILMAYDYHDEGGAAGPISPWSSIQDSVQKCTAVVPPNKLVLGIGVYSLVWQVGQEGAETDSYQEAITAASESGYQPDLKPADALKTDPASLNRYFAYVEEGDNGDQTQQICWLQDAGTAYNSWSIGQDNGISGFSVWELGQEDPGIWTFLDRNVTDPGDPAKLLRSVVTPYEVENVKKGDLLRVSQSPSEGEREIKTDAGTGLIKDMIYRSFPSPYVIEHFGFRHKQVVLTFDDGPDPNYTPRILDILKEKGVHATFFVIGENAEAHSRIVQRIYAEGNEVGSHTFFHPNLGLVSDQRVALELNATQRSIESITGRQTTIFRAPYNADRDPATDEEVNPIVIASALGYTTVGESADPNDWDPTIFDSQANTYRPRTVDDIVRDAIAGVIAFDQPKKDDRDAGNCVLLHDAGGNRDRTIAALPRIIDGLRAKGYKFTTIAGLMGTTRDKVMPPVSDHERLLILLDKVTFTTIFTTLQFIAFAFATAIGLGILRVFVVAPLAIVYERRQKKRVWNPDFCPPVTALIAAYNEEQVIAQTVQSILAGDYPVQEVVVVDDGSQDATGRVVAEAFGDDLRVRLISQENTGKSGALNRGMEVADTELLVTVDADTQLAPDAIGKLIRHFEDPRIGAVAGNVQVGNVYNAVTTWQSIEYTTSQNMDRRAYGLLNCITVVPGAIGAWRKSAIEEVGGHQDDTLAEDMDLTWRLREAGWRQETESYAFGFTEAPETFRAFFRQRFRWAYGTLQCLVKHRRQLFRNGYFGWFALPSIWLFQIVFQALAPLVDLQILISLIGFGLALLSDPSKESSPLGQSIQNLQLAGLMYAIFFAVELLSGIVAYRLERKRYGTLWLLFLQRFAYRQVMYAVVLKSFATAIRGARQGWGKLDRTAKVQI